jgi:PAS domain S-box-containing protein
MTGERRADAAQATAEVADLRARLAEAEDTLAAIRSGDVDAIVVGDEVYTLDSANAATNGLRKDVLAQMEEAVIACDAAGHVIFMNGAAERLYGQNGSAALGHPSASLYRETWPDADSEAAAREALAELGVYRAHSVHHPAGGGAVHVESTVSHLRDTAGRINGRLAVIRDITGRVRAEEALREADRRKDEFLATLAHELRNPLAPISNAVQLLRYGSDPTTQQNARLIIERQLLQLVHLVDDLLDVSRISQGKVVLRREAVDVAAVVQTAVETSRPAIEAGRHALAVRIPPPGALLVDADLTRLTQIIANLLNNAAKFTPEGGSISVSAERDGADALICVEDSGVGIPAELLPRVFDMFAQVDRTLARAQGGLGIGLALVKRLVEMHGGTVAAQSDGQGQGCRFAVRLPLLEPGSSVLVPPATHAHPSPAPEGAIRVLVVDDNVDSADSLAKLLLMLGYETRVAHDGHAALRAARDFRPRVSLLDIGLPGLTGLEVARRIRELDGGDRMLLVALSGWGQEDDRKRSREAGFDHHFVKPVDIEVLTELLAAIETA